MMAQEKLPKAVKVLMVEDCSGDVLLFKERLGEILSVPFEVTDVPRLLDAFEMIERTQYDAIILDLNLLDMNGIVTVAAMRAHVPGIPIIVYSGMDDSRMRESALLCGAKHYLVKGRENPELLKSIVQDVINHH